MRALRTFMAGSIKDGGGTHARTASLTPRESEVLALVGQGLRCREMAARLGIAVFTVRKHRGNILGKLGLHSAVQLATYAVETRPVRGDGDGEACMAAIARLSSRECQVVMWIGQGLTSKQAARNLGISPATVRKHREHIASRTGIRDLAAFARCARVLSNE